MNKETEMQEAIRLAPLQKEVVDLRENCKKLFTDLSQEELDLFKERTKNREASVPSISLPQISFSSDETHVFEETTAKKKRKDIKSRLESLQEYTFKKF